MRLAFLGGSFNPLHIGHCMLAETVARELHYDTVLFVPAFLPPHKQLNGGVLPEQRLEMAEAFCRSTEQSGSSFFSVDDCEMRRGGVSYTYDTLIHIIERYGARLDGKPALIMGQESAAQFCKWHKADEIARLADFIIARRHPCANGVDAGGFENVPAGPYTGDFSGSGEGFSFDRPHILLENPILPISSTEIRSRIAAGKAFRYLVPEAVFQYIMKHTLYGIKNES